MKKTNKEKIKLIVLGLVLGALFLGAIYLEGHCTREGHVISNDNGFVRIADRAGDIWEYDDCDIAEGQNVKMLFDVKDQSSKYDDIILKVWVAKQRQPSKIQLAFSNFNQLQISVVSCIKLKLEKTN